MDRTKLKIHLGRARSLAESLMNGDLLFRIHIDRAFKYVVLIFLAMMAIVFIHYGTDKALSKEKRAQEEFRLAKSKYDKAYCEYMGLIRESNIKDCARNNNLNLDTPRRPARGLVRKQESKR